MSAALDLFGHAVPEVRKPAPRAVLRPVSEGGADPFFITGPAAIAVSGGRSSGDMLRRILKAHGGELPADVVATFQNTGREMEATLRFVNDMQQRWAVPIVWLEYRRAVPNEAETRRWRDEVRATLEARLQRTQSKVRRLKIETRLAGLATRPAPGRQWAEVVTFETASRNGEPFEMMLAGRSMLPNPVMRFCTTELKIRTVKRWIQATLGWKHWKSVVGIRADEPDRLAASPVYGKKERWTRYHPLAEAGITKLDVLRAWRESNFDLDLAGEWEGNCDGCFMKGLGSILRMFQDHSDRMAWWADVERRMKGATVKPGSSFFRVDRDNYSVLEREAATQPRIEFGLLDGLSRCTSGGCGT